MKNLILLPQGGLGNLLFQVACAYSLSKKYNARLFIHTEYDDKRGSIKNFERIFGCFDFVDNNEVHKLMNNYTIYNEPRFIYTEFPDFSNVDTVLIRGYFHSWKYFYENREELKSIFQKNNTMKEYYDKISNGKKTVCLHVRRCDYLRFPEIHPVMDENYYENAIQQFNDDVLFLVFAEDQNDSFRTWKLWEKSTNFIFIEDVHDAINTFFLMSLCDNFIIANSSLSLIAYYFRLNKNPKLIHPMNWFGSKGPKFDINEIIHLNEN